MLSRAVESLECIDNTTIARINILLPSCEQYNKVIVKSEWPETWVPNIVLPSSSHIRCELFSGFESSIGIEATAYLGTV
jgi:hypothetical protein